MKGETIILAANPLKVMHSRMDLASAASLVIEGHPTQKNTLKTSARHATKKIRSSSVGAGYPTNRATTDRGFVNLNPHSVYMCFNNSYLQQTK
jgi:hypothetical protein